MLDELPEAAKNRLYEKHKDLQTIYLPEEDADQRWQQLSTYSDYILKEWFHTKKLDEVISRAKALGHVGTEGGIVLRGKVVADVLSRGSKNMTASDLCKELKTLVKKNGKEVIAHAVSDENPFKAEASPLRAEDIEGFLEKSLKENKGVGSLNTTFDYSYPARGKSGVEALDSYMEALDSVQEKARLADKADKSKYIELNRELYLIWKLQNYVTSYHQDTHIFPHLTMYQQSSGYSVFHFLPVLVGLYVTHLSRTKPVEVVHHVLRELDERNIGSYGIIGPGDVALIYPFGCHGVYVPSYKFNQELLEPFEIALVRAAEFVFTKLKDSAVELLKNEDWNTIMADRPQDSALLGTVDAEISGLRKKLNLKHNEFMWVINRLWKKWEKR